MSKLIFKGWIPVISGNLSFGQIGKTSICNKYKYSTINIVNHSLPNQSQTISVFGNRDLNDSIIPTKQRLEWRAVETMHPFGFIAYAVDNPNTDFLQRDSLTGIVYIAIDKRKNAENEALVKEHFNNPEKIKGIIFSNIINDNTNYGIKAEVEIFRNGTCIIQTEGYENSSEFLDLVKQLHYFLKDICHNHYHHDPKTDSKTTVYLSENKNCKKWAYNTIYSLQRSIVTARHFKSEETLQRALGISAYASTFQNLILKNEKGNFDDNFKGFNFEELNKSISILLEQVKSDKSKKNSYILFAVTNFIAVLAISIGLHQFTDAFPNSKYPFTGTIKNFSEYAIQNPIGTSFFITLAFLALLILSDNYPKILYFAYIMKSMERIHGLLAFSGKKLMAAFWFIISIIGLYTIFVIAKRLLSL